jgi:hypothetical protein
MKSFFNTIYNFLEEIGRTRAAVAAARAGQFDIAKALMK